MDWYTFEYQQRSPWQRHDSGKKWYIASDWKAPETSGGHLLGYVFSLEDAMACPSVTDLNDVLTIEK